MPPFLVRSDPDLTAPDRVARLPDDASPATKAALLGWFGLSRLRNGRVTRLFGVDPALASDLGFDDGYSVEALG